MQVIPVQDIPSQAFSINLAGQQCQIKIYQQPTGMYCDVYVNNSLIIGGVYCADRVRIVQNTYLGFIGDLVWIDSQGTVDPYPPGLGSRYIFYYLTPSDVSNIPT